MKLTDQSVQNFAEQLFSAEPVPGGGGAAALSGVLGAALGGMVGNLTSGKKKYAAVEADIQRILEMLSEKQARLLMLVEEDAEQFAPLAAAYRLPKETEAEQATREQAIQKGLRLAVKTPVEILQICNEVAPLLEELQKKGSRLMLSDVGCGAALVAASARSAWLNVCVNLQTLLDRDDAEAQRACLRPLLAATTALCERIVAEVETEISGEE